MNLQDLNKKMVSCTKCTLSKERTHVVPGEGNSQAEVLFIGEGPGKNEDEQGRPFVGAAGKLLDELLASIKLDRSDVYIANVVKCRPPKNRDPLPEEVRACWPWLEKQVSLIKPKVVVLLGRHSLERFLPKAKISNDHGKAFRKEFGDFGKVVFFSCYHPAAALYNGSLREVLFSDFKKIPKVLEIIESEKKNEKERGKQKSLFEK